MAQGAGTVRDYWKGATLNGPNIYPQSTKKQFTFLIDIVIESIIVGMKFSLCWY